MAARIFELLLAKAEIFLVNVDTFAQFRNCAQKALFFRDEFLIFVNKPPVVDFAVSQQGLGFFQLVESSISNLAHLLALLLAYPKSNVLVTLTIAQIAVIWLGRELVFEFKHY